MDNIDTDPNFLDQIKEFNAEHEAQLDAINTAGDHEALEAMFHKELSQYTLMFARRIRDLALFGTSESASIAALKLATGYLFDAKAKGEDAFERLMGELLEKEV